MKVIINLKKIPSYIWVVFFIQILFLESICLDNIGYNIPIARQLIGFIYLTFVPGSLIIQIFNINDLGRIKYLLYSVGLSISFIIFTGLFINTFFPIVGVDNPISIFYLLITFNFLIIFLLLISSICCKNTSCSLHFSDNLRSSLKYLFSLPNLFILLLPFLSIFGALRMYSYNDNRLSLLLIFLIVFIIGLISIGKLIPTLSYPLVVFSISLSLLWNISLLSYELVGPDIFWEFFAQNNVIINSLWNPQVHLTLNGMLSTVMLVPIYSIFLNLDSTWVYKIIFPLFFSLLPLSLFQIYREQTNDTFSLLSTFFFMSFPVFFSEIIQLPRQQIAELFIVLSVLLFIDKSIDSFKKSILLVVFLFSIIVSHYGTSYIYLLYLLMIISMQYILKLSFVNNLYNRVISKLCLFANYREIPLNLEASTKSSNIFVSNSNLTFNYVLLFSSFCMGWYYYVSAGSIFESAVRITNHISSSIITDFFSINSRDQQIVQALGLSSMRNTNVYWSIARIFQYITQLFILIGALRLFINLKKTTFKVEFILLSFVSLILIGMCIFLPYFSTALNMSRIYHITLLFLSPFFLLGGLSFFEFVGRNVFFSKVSYLSYSALIKLTVFLVLIPYFLFTTGTIFAITDSTKTSMSLSLYDLDQRYFTIPEISGSKWFNQNGVKDYSVYNDGQISSLLLKYTGKYYNDNLFNSKSLAKNSYLYLRRWNIVTNTALVYSKQGIAPKYLNLDEIDLLDSYKWNQIYNNGGSKILYYIYS